MARKNDDGGGTAVETVKRPIDPNSERGQLIAFGQAERAYKTQAEKVAKLQVALQAEQAKLEPLKKAKEEAAAKLKERL